MNVVALALAGSAAAGVVLTLSRHAHSVAMMATRLFFTSVEVSDGDRLFWWLQSWLDAHGALANTRMTVASTKTGRWGDGDERIRYSPAPGNHWLRHGGRRVVVQRTRRELTMPDHHSGRAFAESFILRTFGRSRSVAEDILQAAMEGALVGDNGRVGVTIGRDFGWGESSLRRGRDLESVILADGIAEDISADIRWFLGAESWYADRGLTHQRGYLLSGPPGNGKSSLVLALATEFRLTVATIAFGSKALSDTSLVTLFGKLPPRALVLLEDIDCLFDGRAREDEAGGVTFSGLLNVLDGVHAPDGRILFVTSNHPERIDPALLRPGRIDRRFELANATTDQARRLWLRFNAGDVVGAALFAEDAAAGESMAALTERILRTSRPFEAVA